MPYRDPAVRREQSRNQYRKKFNVTKVRCLDPSPQAKLDFSSCYAGDCIVWTGAANRRGYGCLYLGGMRLSPHRLAYELSHGQIPDGLEIDHLCRSPPCINPVHLEAVTHKIAWTDPSEHYTLTVFASNITNTRYKTSTVGLFYGDYIAYNEPRVIGGSVRFRY